MLNELLEKLKEITAGAKDALAAAASEAEVENVKNKTVGRNGSLTALAPMMGKIAKEDKPRAGKAFNEAKTALQQMLEEARQRLADAAGDASREVIDVTLPGRKWRIGTKHPVSQTIDECCAIFRRMGFVAASGPEIETVKNCFDALNAPADHPSRDPQDTFYFDDGRLLRTQTSTVQIRTMLANQPPIRIVSPGRCYRRDTPDATHGVHFHQIEGLYVDRNVSLADLKNTLEAFASEFFGEGVSIRMRPHFFPFTEPSAECDFSCVMCGGKGCRVCKNSGWLEILGCGMVHPNVLRNVGIDPKEWQGFAFGMGIERLTMLKHRIGDLRLFSDNDLRFLKQF
ncbi:MAG: Phenylalanine--tRNA ligase alpha subunit [Lentisphaerae bacterium ADurb.Bin242]|nr:MAG: Phenylalanine--tRNA ligase alpha subunit [Lentisphaerae bacterium ADurb.Bin242]